MKLVQSAGGSALALVAIDATASVYFAISYGIAV